jgi:hypothetical protein
MMGMNMMMPPGMPVSPIPGMPQMNPVGGVDPSSNMMD